ncbi:MAG: hypothetical protein K2Y27_33515 [Xanthobacteraceae bacterium]|nr:hypothetical protein [Xanthobacteraceae bacterium]
MAVALVAAFVAAFVLGTMPGALAQSNPRLRRVEPLPPGSTTIITRDEFGRTRTRIMVQKRSYLDGGTEVMPADNIDNFRSVFMSHRPGSVLERTAFDRPGWWNDRFFLAGKRNPFPWLGN